MAKISTVMGEAIITEGVWHSENENLAEFLNTMRPVDRTGAVPSYNNWVAEKALSLLPFSKIIDYDEIDYSDEPEGTIY